MTIAELLAPMEGRAQVRITDYEGNTYYLGSTSMLWSRFPFALDCEVRRTTVYDGALEIYIDEE